MLQKAFCLVTMLPSGNFDDNDKFEYTETSGEILSYPYAGKTATFNPFRISFAKNKYEH
jgi:hypothetical protein